MSLQINEVTKVYGKKKALERFSCTLSNGVYGLLGPNGAGKTTLINIIAGVLKPTSGEIFFNGESTNRMGARFLDKIGYLPQHPRFYKNYRAYEFLEYMSALKGIPPKARKQRIEQVLEMVNLSDEKNKKIGSYSGGMRQRLGIAQAMLNNPDILILDEPTAGLDPKERIRFRNLISRLSDNRTVILATHIVPDVEYISEEVILLGAGIKIAQAPAANLMDAIAGKVWDVVADTDKTVQRYMERYSISNVVRRDDGYHLRVVSDNQPADHAVSQTPSLEDIYLYYFGEVGS